MLFGIFVTLIEGNFIPLFENISHLNKALKLLKHSNISGFAVILSVLIPRAQSIPYCGATTILFLFGLRIGPLSKKKRKKEKKMEFHWHNRRANLIKPI